MTDIDLNFIGKQLNRLLTEVANIKDDMTVLTAMVVRLEASVQALTVETRAMQRQIGRMNDRISKVEDAVP